MRLSSARASAFPRTKDVACPRPSPLPITASTFESPCVPSRPSYDLSDALASRSPAGSWACGWLLNRTEPAAVALHSSRGYQTPSSKLFMRAAALVSDLAVYHTGVVAAAAALHPPPAAAADATTTAAAGGWAQWPQWKRRRLLAAAAAVLQPGLVAIDHGHFQFNRRAGALVRVGIVR